MEAETVRGSSLCLRNLTHDTMWLQRGTVSLVSQEFLIQPLVRRKEKHWTKLLVKRKQINTRIFKISMA